MTGVYRQNPAAAWRYREPDRFVALHSLFVAPTIQEDPAPFLVERNARHPWLYSLDPDVQWHFHGRKVMVPIGVPQQTAIEVPAGQISFAGLSAAVSTGQIEGLVQVPMERPSLTTFGGVYRSQGHIRRRLVTIAEGSPAPPVSGVEINAPAGVATFLGQVADLGDTIINVPRGNFTAVGLIASIVVGGVEGIKALFQAERTTATFQEQRTTQVFVPEDTDVREL